MKYQQAAPGPEYAPQRSNKDPAVALRPSNNTLNLLDLGMPLQIIVKSLDIEQRRKLRCVNKALRDVVDGTVKALDIIVWTIHWNMCQPNTVEELVQQFKRFQNLQELTLNSSQMEEVFQSAWKTVKWSGLKSVHLYHKYDGPLHGDLWRSAAAEENPLLKRVEYMHSCINSLEDLHTLGELDWPNLRNLRILSNPGEYWTIEKQQACSKALSNLIGKCTHLIHLDLDLEMVSKEAIVPLFKIELPYLERLSVSYRAFGGTGTFEEMVKEAGPRWPKVKHIDMGVAMDIDNVEALSRAPWDLDRLRISMFNPEVAAPLARALCRFKNLRVLDCSAACSDPFFDCFVEEGNIENTGNMNSVRALLGVHWPSLRKLSIANVHAANALAALATVVSAAQKGRLPKLEKLQMSSIENSPYVEKDPFDLAEVAALTIDVVAGLRRFPLLQALPVFCGHRDVYIHRDASVLYLILCVTYNRIPIP